MATRSTISIQNLDGSINTIYSHWDGYISCNGVILQTYYNDREKVAKLIMGGGISSLGRYISDTPLDFDNRDSDYTNYYSYRGEITSIDYYKDFDDYEQNHQSEEYDYLYTTDNVWSVFDGNEWYDLEYLIQEQGLKDPYTVAEAA
jgi:hypothetical protein